VAGGKLRKKGRMSMRYQGCQPHAGEESYVFSQKTLIRNLSKTDKKETHRGRKICQGLDAWRLARVKRLKTKPHIARDFEEEVRLKEEGVRKKQ